MRAKASPDGLTCRVIAGTNSTLLAFDLNEAKRAACPGFSIERTDLDPNSLIIRGGTAVMDIYATEFMRMFEHDWPR